MTERFTKKLPPHEGLTSKVTRAVDKGQFSKRKILELDKTFDQLDQVTKEIVNNMVEATSAGEISSRDISWALSANEEGIDPDTILRIWERVELPPTPNMGSMALDYSSKKQ